MSYGIAYMGDERHDFLKWLFFFFMAAMVVFSSYSSEGSSVS